MAACKTVYPSSISNQGQGHAIGIPTESAGAYPGLPYPRSPYPTRVISVSIPLDMAGLWSQGGIRFNPTSYTRDMASVMTETEFHYIVSQLNECAARHGPNTSCYSAGMSVPIVGPILVPIAVPILSPLLVPMHMSGAKGFRRELEATCQHIVKQSRHRGMQLRVVGSGAHMRVDMELVV